MRTRQLLLAVALVLLGGTVFAAPPPDTPRMSLNHPNVFAMPQVSSPPIQFQNGGTPIGIAFTFNCSTGMTCSIVNGVLVATATGSAMLTFPVTVSGATSGGVPCFDSTTDMNTSALLTNNAAMFGGGAGACVKVDTGITTNGSGILTVTSITTTGITMNNSASIAHGTGVILNTSAPTIAAAGCGGSAASILSNNGTGAFRVGVGTSNTGTCTITMPNAGTGHVWNCSATDITTTSTSVSSTKQTSTGSNTQITLQNYTDVSGTAAWVDGDTLAVICLGD